MHRKFILALVSPILLGLLFSGSDLLGSPFVPLEWRSRVKSGPLEDQYKHVGWSSDLDGDFIDDAFSELDPGDTTDVILQLSDCACDLELTNRFGRFGTIEMVGELVAYVHLSGVRVEDLSELAQDPLVAAVERPGELHLSLDTSTRSVLNRSSVNYDKRSPDDTDKPGTFEQMFLGECGDDIKCDGSGINVAIVDGGVYGDDEEDDPTPTHNTLGDDRYVGGYDAYHDEERDPVPINTHGTYVAGIAVGKGCQSTDPGCTECRAPTDDNLSDNYCQGMAPGAGWLDVRATDDIGFMGHGVYLKRALEWIWKDGRTDVVNISLNHDGDSRGDDTETQLINALVMNGISVSVAAGNANDAREMTMTDALASADLAVTVGAVQVGRTVNRDDDDMVWLSRSGPRLDFRNQFCCGRFVGEADFQPTLGMLKPDIVAPGQVFSANNTADGYSDTGAYTSFASPHVAGAMALLLQMRPDLPPGALKNLLRRSAYVTQEHSTDLTNDEEPWHTIAECAHNPDCNDWDERWLVVDERYHSQWGVGMLDVHAAAELLVTQGTDLSFSHCEGCLPNLGRCSLKDHTKASWQNIFDIVLESDLNPEDFPLQVREPNIIHVWIENRGSNAADNVVVSVGVQDLTVGVNKFYNVGSKVVESLPAHSDPVEVPFEWSPRLLVPAEDMEEGVEIHQCIQATIDYGVDTDYCNNKTVRNVSKIKGASPTTAYFRVQNPLNEDAEIELEMDLDKKAEAILATPPYVTGVPIGQRFTMSPRDCPILAQIDLIPHHDVPVGSRGLIRIKATAYSSRYPQGIELSGVAFDYEVVDAALWTPYSVARHGDAGAIDVNLTWGGPPTSEPRRRVQRIKSIFNVSVTCPTNFTLEEAIQISSLLGSEIPPYRASFAEGASFGKVLTVKFRDPLPDQERYIFDFSNLVDLDGDALGGVSNFDMRVVQGDTDGDGTVTGTDISFVRERINREVEYGTTSRADCNQTGGITGADISYVRGRVGNAAP